MSFRHFNHKKRALLPQTDSNSNALFINFENNFYLLLKLFSYSTLEQILGDCQDPNLASDWVNWKQYALIWWLVLEISLRLTQDVSLANLHVKFEIGS